MKKIPTIPDEFKRYEKTILEFPKYRTIRVSMFGTKVAADAKAQRLKSWPFKKVVHARDEHGYFAKGWALICCK